MKIAKKVEDCIKNGAVKFRKVLEAAKNRDLSESDTVAIITDMLAEVFGYEKYSEITSELMIRGTFCDLAIRLNDSFEKGSQLAFTFRLHGKEGGTVKLSELTAELVPAPTDISDMFED